MTKDHKSGVFVWFGLLIFLLLIGVIVSICYYSANEYQNQGYSMVEKLISPKIFIINLDRKPERYTYVSDQLDKFGFKDYQRWPAVDGFNSDLETLMSYGLASILCDRRGLAGCAASHIDVWRHIVKEKIEWTLILEDDAYFHPRFPELFRGYTEKIPKDTKIAYLGYCGVDEDLGKEAVVKYAPMCMHAYLISYEGAQHILNNIGNIENPIDIELLRYFKKDQSNGCYIFNGNAFVNGIRPHDYKENNSGRCQFEGIVYQNRQELGSTIHEVNTVYF